MKIKTILSIRKFKEKTYDNYIKILRFILYPLLYVLDKIDKKKINKKRDIKNYNQDKLEKLIYKTIQDDLMSGETIHIFDVDYISEEDKYWEYKRVKDLFNQSKYNYIKNYRNYHLSKVKEDEWFDIIKGFDNDEISVREIDKDEIFSGKYDKYCRLYKESRRVLKINIKG